jgi:dihydrofolate reductase
MSLIRVLRRQLRYKYMISIIAAIDKNRALGYQNKLLVHLPEDLAHFKQITSGHPVIMGQNTYLSIGRALPNRVNIVLSKNKDFSSARLCGF